ncbi:MAG TPA: tetratricopeptide repeat protein [Amycolatopsis sp.]|uniref:AfsR/SARP family transcriptional regulator n=1 Tax=Amycolatopsis sp. TaxID=37632 RepID=UPI002B464362|nr:tetratricopeptide repeat protein [Amycolatopsis sp.]HKS48278.1 tetratricopeptide repeat protein [Amycolatopsis sp.]
MLGFLGPTVVRMHGHLTERWGRSQDHAVLAVLLAQVERRVAIPTLVAQAWPDEKNPQNSAPTLHTYANRIRATLRASDSSATLENNRGAYQLHADRRSIDYYQFTELISCAHQADENNDHDQVSALIENAISLWRDTPLADVHTEWASNWRRSIVVDEWLPANVLLVDAYLELGRFDRATRRLNELQREHRLHLGLAQRRLRLLRLQGRDHDAAEYYMATRKNLIREGDHGAAEGLRHYHDSIAKPSAHPALTTKERAVRAGAPPRPPRQLPQDVTALAGRQDVLAELDVVTGTGEGRPHPTVVVLTGPPGIGKTATAVRWAYRSSPHFPFGTLFADLRGFSPSPPLQPADVVDSFLAALDYPAERIISAAGRAEKLRSLLAERPMLVVLDNAADSTHVTPLLGLLATCVVIVTSRRRLGSLTARYSGPTLTLDRLPLGVATDMVTARIGPRAHHEPDTAREIARLCDGLPLALTLMAERAASRAGARLRDLVTQLSDRDVLLNLGEDSDALTESLAAAFSCSYTSLAGPEQRLFGLLGLHPTSDISVHAAAALLGETPARTRRSLDKLLGAHLLEQRSDLGHYQLHDLLYAYAEKVGSDEESREAGQRLVEFYLQTAANAHSTVFPHRPGPPLPPITPGYTPITFNEESEAEHWCLRERANLTAVVGYAAKNGMDQYAWLLPHATLFILDRFGHYETAVSGLEVAAMAAARCGDVEAEASTLNDLGQIKMLQGDHDAAGRYLRRSLDLATRHRSATGVLTALLNTARCERELHRLDEAIKLLKECDILARTIADAGREATVAYQLGEALREKLDRSGAQRQFERALTSHEKVGDIVGQVETFAALADLACDQDSYSEADRHIRQASELLNRCHDTSARIHVSTVLARLRHAQNRPVEAIQHAENAIALAREARSTLSHATALERIGEIYHDQGEHHRAHQAWASAHALFTGRGHPDDARRVGQRLRETGNGPSFIPLARESGWASTHPDRSNPNTKNPGREKHRG